MLRQLGASRNRSKGSIPAALFGLLLCIGSVVMLWANEGRPDLSKVARHAILVPADSSGAEGEGQLVSINGWVDSENPASDAEFGVGGDYLRLQRNVEMYAWVEEHDSEDDIYTYEKQWTSRPENSDSFKYPLGHTNPPQSIPEQTFYAQRGWVGNFSFDPAEARLISSEPIVLTQDIRLPAGATMAGGYIYMGQGTPSWPLVGDVRISYEAVPTGRNVSLFGQLQGEHVNRYVDGKAKLYGIWEGGHDQALDAMHREYVTIGWMMRIGGFIMMWIGMNMILSPLTNILGYVPLLGQVGRGVVMAVTFALALVISLLIIIVSFVVHRWYLLLLLLLVIAGVAVLMHRRQQQRAEA